MTHYFILFLCLFVASGVQAQPSPHTPTITFTCSLPEDMPAAIEIRRYYELAFANLGYQFEMLHRPIKRALAEARSGTSDGECARITRFFDQSEVENHQLIPINVVVGISTMNIWSREQGPLTASDLLHSEHNICYITGSTASEIWLNTMIEKTGQTPAFFAVNSYETGLRMLSFGRITHCIGPQISFQAAAQKINLSGQVYNNGQLLEIEAGPLLHVRHQAIAEDFTRELQKVVDKHGILQH
ncbi:hypothetical protein [Gilvimarinus chinensis]|uniref:hypothetical protein n=1 Tax=Gilvimarinus chinensis TaxID=396005 RepID=UPI00036F1DCE|nr:hypothetical protein [Gilvimarinus chinensis]